MPNYNYIKGRNKEYAIIKKLRNKGFDIVVRTAGSHSPIDVFAIDSLKKYILFVQSKPKDISQSALERILNQNKELTGMFVCKFIVL